MKHHPATLVIGFAAIGLAFSSHAQVQFVENVAYAQNATLDNGQVNADVQTPSTQCSRISSDDGRYVVFDSVASNLVAGDTNNESDVFLRDTVENTIKRISVYNDGSEMMGRSSNGCISSDGRYVSYVSDARLLSGAELQGRDVFVYDNQTGQREHITVPLPGCTSIHSANYPSISGDGNTVIFTSSSSCLTTEAASTLQIYRHDRTSGTTTLISKNTSGSAAGVSGTSRPSLSDDGRYIVFNSTTTSLVTGDNNAKSDAFLYDHNDASMKRVSVDALGNELSSGGYDAVISHDGTRVLFSTSDDLLPPDDDSVTGFSRSDLYLYQIDNGDLVGGSLELVTQTPSGDVTNIAFNYQPHLSGDGRKVTFISKAGVMAGNAGGYLEATAFIRDMDAGTTTLVAPNDNDADGGASKPFLSHDGSRLLFFSDSPNHVAGDDNGNVDLFRATLAADNTTTGFEKISTANEGVYVLSGANSGSLSRHRPQRAISDDGRYVIFASGANNIEPTTTPLRRRYAQHWFWSDRKTGTSIMIDRPPLSEPYVESRLNTDSASISADGLKVVHDSAKQNLVTSDTNFNKDIFLWDATTRTHTMLNINSSGDKANRDSYEPAISADGQHVVFASEATNLTADALVAPYNVFHIDLTTNAITLISKNTSGTAADGNSRHPNISADGRYVVFESEATDLVTGDVNGVQDVFVYDRSSDVMKRVSVSSTGDEADDASFSASISDDGSTVLFTSEADNLGDDPGDNASLCDVYVHTLSTSGNGVTEVVSINSDGTEQAGASTANHCQYLYAGLSADGRYVMFSSSSDNLSQAGDTDDINGRLDVFVHDRNTNATRRVSEDSLGTQNNSGSEGMGISADGRYVVVRSEGIGWQLDAGVVSWSYQGLGFAPHVIEREGMAEATTSELVASSITNVVIGTTRDIEVLVQGSATTPSEGIVTVQASSGESCQSEAILPTDQTNSIRFSCALTFNTLGERTLHVTYRLSPSHAASATTANINVTTPVTPLIFDNGFE